MIFNTEKSFIKIDDLEEEVQNFITNVVDELSTRLNFDCDRYQYFEFKERIIDKSRYQLIIHSQKTHGYNQKYFIPAKKILKDKYLVIDVLDTDI